MRSFRDIKRDARRNVHQVMRIPALYLSSPSDDTGVPIHVRIHRRPEVLGLEGAEAGLAERREIVTSAIFMSSELADAGIAPKRGALLSIADGEAYKLDNRDPRDDITVRWYLSALSEQQAHGLPLPEDE